MGENYIFNSIGIIDIPFPACHFGEEENTFGAYTAYCTKLVSDYPAQHGCSIVENISYCMKVSGNA